MQNASVVTVASVVSVERSGLNRDRLKRCGHELKTQCSGADVIHERVQLTAFFLTEYVKQYNRTTTGNEHKDIKSWL